MLCNFSFFLEKPFGVDSEGREIELQDNPLVLLIHQPAEYRDLDQSTNSQKTTNDMHIYDKRAFYVQLLRAYTCYRVY